MHGTETARAVANPRRTRLGADWTARSAGTADPSGVNPEPAPEAGAGERSLD
ncbi:hypothetical protein ACFV4N_07445 [Actinosynnema sp. NPDC059797]